MLRRSVAFLLMITGAGVHAQGLDDSGAGIAFPATAILTEAELSKETGKFMLPNGVSLALSVTSDTVLDGKLILRTVFTVDQGSQLRVYGSDSAATGGGTSVATGSGGQMMAPSGVSVLFDRASGTRTVTPTFNVATPVSVGTGKPADAAAQGLTPLALVPGSPAVRTPDGLVSLTQTARGAQVTLTGDQLGIAHLVGDAIATAVINSGNNRTIDTATSVDIDLRNVAPFAAGSAAMRVDSLALEATRGMTR